MTYNSGPPKPGIYTEKRGGKTVTLAGARGRMKKIKKVRNPVFRWVLIACGIMSTAAGILGMFLPVLPTTPFLLLAAFCFARSSDKFYSWLLGNKVFGKYLENYMQDRGIPAGIKIYALALLWLSVSAALIFFVKFLPARIIIFAAASAVTWHIISVKTLVKGKAEKPGRKHRR